MQERFRHEVPSEFTDEEKWLHIFNKKQLKFFLVSVAVTILLSKFTETICGRKWIGIVIGVICGLIATGSTFIFVPETEYLKGANLSMDIILVRKTLRRINRKIYVKGYGEDAWV